MSRPKSNAPSDMTPWVKATEKEIDSLKRKVSSLERTSVSPSGNTGGIYGATNVLDVSQTVSGSITANISNANFDTNTTMSSDLDVAGTLSVGQKTRQFTYFDGGLGEYVTEERDAPDFRLVGGQQSVNPVTGVDEYSQAVLSLEDVTLAAFQTHGMIVADGLDIEMQDLADYYYQSEPIQSISNSGGITTITILDTANALATYGPGVYINISGASAYDTTHACINTLTTDSVFITMTIDYTGGIGTVTTGNIMVDYGYLKTKNTIAIQGANPMYQFVRVTQNGFSAGYDGTGLAQESLATNRLGPDGITASNYYSDGILRLETTEDASPTSDLHPFQVGLSSGANIRIDNNEIIAVNNGAIAPLYINSEGSSVNIGNSGSANLNVTGTADSSTAVTTNGKSGVALTQSAGAHLNSSGYGLFARSNATPCYIHRYGTSGTSLMVQFIYNGANNGTINVASGGTPAFASGSDYRIKEDVQPVTDALERMRGIQAYTFRKIKEVDPEQNLQTGFIAHEVAAVHPEAVIGEKDAVDEDGNPEYQQVMDAKLTPLMAQAIKELILKNEALEARIAALEAR